MRKMDPTARGDMHADLMRAWYEVNRESWFDRHQISPLGRATDRSGVHSDEFMLCLITAVYETEKQLPK